MNQVGEWCHGLELLSQPTFSFLPYPGLPSWEAYLTPPTWHPFLSGAPLTRCALAPGSILGHSPPTPDPERFSRSTLPTSRVQMTAEATSHRESKETLGFPAPGPGSDPLE